ncbi:hypothetical protein BC830DRAFT_1129740 [Chytriomyces sp. MP71]|nr:hypothetical protein BC830DRAFT_1129740 [Chytriomyces sp. MP71]
MSNSGAMCLPLQASAMCPDFAGFKAYIPAGAPITNIATFDSFVQQSYGSGFRDLVTRSSMGGYQCSGWNGSNLRFMHSVVCAYYVGMGFAYGTSAGSVPCNSGMPQPIPLCASTFDSFSASWDAIMNDRTICAAGVSPNSQNYKALLMTAKALGSTDTACLSGELEENNNCGFQAAGDAIAFCASPSNVAANTCCVQFAPTPTTSSADTTITSTTSNDSAPIFSEPPSTTTTTVLIAIASSSNAENRSINIAPMPSASAGSPNQASSQTASASSGTSSTGLIAGVAAVVVVAILAGAGFIYLRRKRHAVDSHVAKDYKLSKMNGSFERPSPSAMAANAADIGVASIVAGTPTKGETGEALSDYNPQQADEMQVKRRDKITIDRVFDDSWATGFNHRTIRDGVFPLAVFYPPENDIYRNLYNKRMSSIYGAGAPPSPTSIAPPPVQKEQTNEPVAQPKQQEQQVFIAAFNFIPELQDEIPVTIGDKIALVQNFDDGWAIGYSFRLNKKGLFPQECLFGAASKHFTAAEAQKKKRVSSIYYSSNNAILDAYADSGVNRHPDSENFI